ncbi:putative transcription factor [Arabidopsis thaliana]
MDKANTNGSKKEVCGGSGEAKPTGKKRKNERTLTNKNVNAKEGMMDFKAVTRHNPSDDMNGAYNFLHEYISFEEEIMEKMGINAKDLSSSIGFELLKLIWGYDVKSAVEYNLLKIEQANFTSHPQISFNNSEPKKTNL